MFTATQQRLYGLLFGQPRRSFFLTELIELAGIGRGAVQRELARLERGRLVVTEHRGNRKHFQANPDSPVFREICSTRGQDARRGGASAHRAATA